LDLLLQTSLEAAGTLVTFRLLNPDRRKLVEVLSLVKLPLIGGG